MASTHTITVVRFGGGNAVVSVDDGATIREAIQSSGQVQNLDRILSVKFKSTEVSLDDIVRDSGTMVIKMGNADGEAPKPKGGNQ